MLPLDTVYDKQYWCLFFCFNSTHNVTLLHSACLHTHDGKTKKAHTETGRDYIPGHAHIEPQ